MYGELLDNIKLLSVINKEGFYYKLSALSNITAALMSNIDNINWVGFYFVGEDNLLHLGPFQGEVACSELTKDRGVCAASVREKRVVVVDDVESFEGHVVCDSKSRSELVVPLIVNDKVYGVLDVDSPSLSRFKEQEIEFFEKIGQLVSFLVPLT
jgi:L-methionine (R)-S-oxide reductase